MAPRVLVTEQLAPRGLDALSEAGFDVDERLGVSADELVEAVKGANALIIRSATRVTAEILDAARRFAAKRVAQSAEGRSAGPLALQSDEDEFRACLYAPEMHDHDLIIRTSGERRLSNYLLWQSAYSELVFREELWPDFTRAALEESLAEYAERRRRFGGR